MAEGGNGDDRNWSMWLRLLSHSVHDTAGSAAADETTVLQAVKNLQQLCSKGDQYGDLVARVYPHLTKIFSRCSGSSFIHKTSTGLLLLALLALMDEAHTWSIIADSQGDAANGGRGSTRDETEALFADLLWRTKLRPSVMSLVLSTDDKLWWGRVLPPVCNMLWY